MSKPKTITLVLKFSVEYQPNGTSEAQLRDLLAGIINHAMDRGLVTGETSATVIQSHIEVRLGG
jgi:hypothetical protein